MAELWQQELQRAIGSVDRLAGYAFLGTDAQLVENKFRTLVPEYYLNLIDKSDPEDPIAKMAFPEVKELLSGSTALRDPIGDLSRQVAPRLTHRYPDRALLHVTNLCPMYCRFCFRKNLMNEKEEELYVGDFQPAANYLSAHPAVRELIFSGGDPWMLGDHKLSELVDLFLKSAPQLEILRFHTRMPVTLPARITDGLISAISRMGKKTIVVTHFNHPREISEVAKRGISKLANAGITVLNQSVLLKGVNDRTEILQDLFRGLGSIGVLPYYLHHCDLVSGAEHFRTSITAGQALWRSLRGTIPGYLLPEYVLEIPGAIGKVPVAEPYVKALGGGVYSLEHHGTKVEYRDPV